MHLLKPSAWTVSIEVYQGMPWGQNGVLGRGCDVAEDTCCAHLRAGAWRPCCKRLPCGAACACRGTFDGCGVSSVCSSRIPQSPWPAMRQSHVLAPMAMMQSLPGDSPHNSLGDSCKANHGACEFEIRHMLPVATCLHALHITSSLRNALLPYLKHCQFVMYMTAEKTSCAMANVTCGGAGITDFGQP